MATGMAAGLERGDKLRYRLLGGIGVERDGEPLDLGGRKQRAVLAALLVDAGRVVSVGQLLDRVWGDAVPGQATASLQAYVSNLRRLLDPDRDAGRSAGVIVTEAGGYRIDVDRDRLDIARFEDLRDDGLSALAAGDPAKAANCLNAALALFGPVLPELAGEPWVMEQAARLDAVHAEVLEASFEAKLALGQDSGILAGLEAAVTAHPFRERLRGQLALALYRSGRQTEALRSLAAARRTLADEIGVEPGPDLRQLEADILAQAPALTESAKHTEAVAASPTTPAADGSREVALVGRSDELDALIDAARRAAGGAGGTAVISGEPGIGKTRLAEELAAQVAHFDAPGGGSDAGRGIVVAWARCPESAAAAPGWTCTHLFEQVVAAGVLDGEAVRNAAAHAGPPPSGLADPGAERFEFHVAATATLRTTTRPMLLVIDDLQWADPSSLRLLEFLAGELRTMPVLLVVTIRPLGPEPAPALVACLGELARHSTVRRLELAGLGSGEIEAWLSRRAAGTVDPAVVALVHERTAGNPFFVSEIVELLAARHGFADASTARELGVPAAVQDVVRRRIDLLPEETRKLLATAAVLGVRVELDLLAHVAAHSVPATLEALDPAIEAGLLTEDRLAPGQLRFAHALVADALLAELALSRRARLHAAAVEALEDLRPSERDDEHLARLAYHAAEGAVAGTGMQAVEYASRAARLATGRAQHEEAVVYWEQAIRLADLARPGDQAGRLGMLIELGDSRRRADDFDGAQEALLAAMNLADVLGDRDTERRAATLLPITSVWVPSFYGQARPALVAALQRVLAGFDDAPSAPRAEVLGCLADLVYYSHADLSDAWSLEAVEVARQVPDGGDERVLTLGRALNRRHMALQRPSRTGERRAVAEEIIALANDPGLAADLACVGYYGRATSNFEQGDVGDLGADLARCRSLAQQAGSPELLTQVAWTDVAWLLAQGRYDQARSVAQDTATLHRRARRWVADSILAAYLTLVAHDRGNLADLPDELTRTFEEHFAEAARELQVWMLAETGLLGEVRAMVGPMGTAPEVPRDWMWLAMQTIAAYSRSALGDVDACRTLYERLLPHRGTLATCGPGGPVFGAVDQALAQLALVIGDVAAARRHIAAAVELLDRIGARPWLARALLTEHTLLAESDDPADRADAASVFDRCHRLAADLGLAPVLAALKR